MQSYLIASIAAIGGYHLWKLIAKKMLPGYNTTQYHILYGVLFGLLIAIALS